MHHTLTTYVLNVIQWMPMIGMFMFLTNGCSACDVVVVAWNGPFARNVQMLRAGTQANPSCTIMVLEHNLLIMAGLIGQKNCAIKVLSL